MCTAPVPSQSLDLGEDVAAFRVILAKISAEFVADAAR
jgi:hypothetical protein